jgi:hypothetical protein
VNILANILIINEMDKPLYSKITDGREILHIVDGASDSIDFAHAKIHQGVSYTITKLLKNVANNAYADLHIITGDEQTHLTIVAQAEGKCYTLLYRGTTYSNTGTAVTVYNCDDSSANTTASTVKYAPTITLVGTLLYEDFIPGGVGKNIFGADLESRHEYILRTFTDYLVRVQNASTVAIDISITFNYYELEDED